MPFRDDYRLGHPVDTRAACDAADEQYAQECAAQAGGTCFDVAQAIGDVLDRRIEDWNPDDKPALDRLHALLSQALMLARQINPEPRMPAALLAECAAAAGIATAHNPED